MDTNERVDKVLEILMRDYEAMRTEIRAAEARHERTSFWLSSGLLAALAACFKPEFRIGLIFLPLVILAYWAHRLYSHTLHIATLSRWVMRTEELVDKLLKTEGLLDWERHFVRTALKSFSLFSFTSQGIYEGFMMLPSVIVFSLSVWLAPTPMAENFKVSLILAKTVIWAGYAFLFLVLLVAYCLFSKTSQELEEARTSSVQKVYDAVMGRGKPVPD